MIKAQKINPNVQVCDTETSSAQAATLRLNVAM